MKRDDSHKSMVVPDSMTHQVNLFLVNIDTGYVLVVTGVKHGFRFVGTFTAATWL